MKKLVVLAMMSASAMAFYGLAANERASAQPAAPKPAEQVIVLDNYSVWRTHQTFKPPTVRLDEGPKPVLGTQSQWINRETPPPPEGWAKEAFDDSNWLRGTALAFAHTPYLSRLVTRGRFEVTDPAQAKDLKLSLGYYGGVIVYVNGQEVTRGNVAKDGVVELADDYSDDVFVGAGGKVLGGGGVAGEEVKPRLRALADVAIPEKVLHKGVNVLTIEVVPSAYSKALLEKVDDKNKKDVESRGCSYTLTWGTCQLRSVKLSGSAAGVVPSAARPKEWQAWNGDILTADFESDMADRCVTLGPVTIKAVRNGFFSAKVVVSSGKAIEGLKAAVTDLKNADSAIPASAVRIRYAAPWKGGSGDFNYTHPYASMQADALLEAPVESFPVAKYGAVVPIWITVRVPASAKAGAYSGQLTISAKGEQNFTAPVKLEVGEWSLPDQDNWRAWSELVQSPDTLSLEYDAPLWSDKHWDLIAQSMRYIGEMGARTVYVPLICHTNFGNADSMVRWIKKPDGSYDYDFAIMDKYLDLAQKLIGKPKIVCFTVWEVYLGAAPKAEVKITEEDRKDPYTYAHKAADAARWENRGKGPLVTVLDPATGKTEMINLPRFEDPAAKAVWKPLFDELHKRMAKRGLEGSMMLGMASDTWPTKSEVAAIQDVSGNLAWVSHTHGGNRVVSKLQDVAPLAYFAYVWNNVLPSEPEKGRTYGWKRPELQTQYMRFGALNDWPLATIMHFEELNITGMQRGVGRIGADFWPAIKDKKGDRRGYAVDRYPESFWHSLNLTSHMLVPGPTGPVESTRYEIFREGLQECEARIAIETVLTDPALKAKLPAELAQKAQDVLDERLREVWRSGSDLQLAGPAYRYATAPVTHADGYGGQAGQYWFAGSGWLDRAQAFYALADEVQRKVGGK